MDGDEWLKGWDWEWVLWDLGCGLGVGMISLSISAAGWLMNGEVSIAMFGHGVGLVYGYLVDSRSVVVCFGSLGRLLLFLEAWLF